MITSSPRVRAVDFHAPWFRERAKELAEPLLVHRKLWEFAIICQVFLDQCQPHSNVMGFGVGLEPLPCWFAMKECTVLATDQSSVSAHAWTHTGQHAANLQALWKPAICSETTFDRFVYYSNIDMNRIPDTLRHGKFDFIWSCGSFEHLGSLNHGMEFVCNAMKCLKTGGIAVHTTEFNPDNWHPTLESKDLSLYRERDLLVLMNRLTAQGDNMLMLDLTPGFEPEDCVIDQEPWGIPHLSIHLGPYVTTSIALVIQRG
jgi:hypothetical protein